MKTALNVAEKQNLQTQQNLKIAIGMAIYSQENNISKILEDFKSKKKHKLE